jgi:hypothetical protein
MFRNIKSREPREWQNHHPQDNHPTPLHLLGGAHQPPHIRASRIRLKYDEDTISRLGQLYDDVEYVVDILETCPPEIKLTLAMLLGIQVDLREYPQAVHPMVRFATPFLNDQNSGLISQALDCSESDVAVNIYNTCPPEQALLALAVATLKKTGGEA